MIFCSLRQAKEVQGGINASKLSCSSTLELEETEQGPLDGMDAFRYIEKDYMWGSLEIEK